MYFFLTTICVLPVINLLGLTRHNLVIWMNDMYSTYVQYVVLYLVKYITLLSLRSADSEPSLCHL